MRSKLGVTIASVAVLALVIGVVAFVAQSQGWLGQLGGSDHGSGNPWFGPASYNGTPIACPAVQTPAGSVVGSPAVTPRIAHPGAEQAAYSVADLRAYLLGNPPWSSAEHVTIYGVQLMDVSHAAALDQGQCVALSGAAPVYLVTLHGDFPVNAWPTAGALPGTPPPTAVVSHVVQMVFDAHTGNLVTTSSGAGSTGQ